LLDTETFVSSVSHLFLFVQETFFQWFIIIEYGLKQFIILVTEVCTQVGFAWWQGKAEGLENSFNSFRY